MLLRRVERVPLLGGRMSLEAIREGLAASACFRQSPRRPAPVAGSRRLTASPQRFTAMAVKDKLKTDLFRRSGAPAAASA